MPPQESLDICSYTYIRGSSLTNRRPDIIAIGVISQPDLRIPPAIGPIVTSVCIRVAIPGTDPRAYMNGKTTSDVVESWP